jgi:calcium-dependent protein kinase
MIRAAKVIKRNTLNPENEMWLLYETEILKNIDHPNIVKIFEIFADV